MGRQNPPRNAARVVLLGCAVVVSTGCAPSFSEVEKRDMRDTKSDYQRAVLDDLVVSEAEYRNAVDATRDCLQDKGFGVGGVEQDGNQLGFSSSYDGPHAASEGAMQACHDEYLNQVAAVWVSQRISLTS
ncbi:hypothetical protein E8P82_10750 [Arthrobacter echini]|uniref:Uncharacterized protein n=1 Tax=Arthrobacter echini TaxID=1529066 RepID=A0A4S5E328_9MICC|nr:hypothetical protein [Arthrobacter echini]THJ65762.1 hypothetical protein E8P82_10750 [Arthrobacter echini]